MGTVSVVLIVVAIVGLVVVAMAVQSLISTMRSLRRTVEELRVETHTAVAEMRAMVAEANGEIGRIDSLLDTAEVVGARVEATSRLAWLVMRNPLVKLASSSVATDRVARRLSRVDDAGRGPRVDDAGRASRIDGVIDANGDGPRAIDRGSKRSRRSRTRRAS